MHEDEPWCDAKNMSSNWAKLAFEAWVGDTECEQQCLGVKACSKVCCAALPCKKLAAKGNVRLAPESATVQGKFNTELCGACELTGLCRSFAHQVRARRFELAQKGLGTSYRPQ